MKTRISTKLLTALKQHALNVRRAVILTSAKAGSVHIASALSPVDILTALYFEQGPWRTRFVLCSRRRWIYFAKTFKPIWSRWIYLNGASSLEGCTRHRSNYRLAWPWFRYGPWHGACTKKRQKIGTGFCVIK